MLTEQEEKNAKKYLKTAAHYISKGRGYKKDADCAKTKKEAEEKKEWAKDYFKKAKEVIATTKEKQNMLYDEKKVYEKLKQAVKKRKDGDSDAIGKAVEKIIKAEK